MQRLCVKCARAEQRVLERERERRGVRECSVSERWSPMNRQACELTFDGDTVITAQFLQFLLLSFSFMSQLLFLQSPLFNLPLNLGSLLLLLFPPFLVDDRLLKG